jgi:hypothetical protein
MPEYTDGTISLIQAALGVAGAVFLITLLLNGLAVVIRRMFFK